MLGVLNLRIRPTIPHRLMLCIIVAIAAGLVYSKRLEVWDVGAGDFAWPLVGAQRLLNGQNPYRTPLPDPVYPYLNNVPLLYPLPALAVALPFTPFAPGTAALLFASVSAALLAWAVTKDGWAKLPILLSAPFCLALASGQWSPLLTAVALLPALRPLLMCKPTVGLPLFVRYGNWRTIAGMALILLISLAVLPSWPLDWLHNTRTHAHVIPLLTWSGPFLLLALLRVREDRNAWLLLAMSAMPQNTYDPLALLLIPQSALATLALAIVSWGSIGRDIDLQVFVAWIYLPALTCVLWPIIPVPHLQTLLTNSKSRVMALHRYTRR